MDGVHFVFLTTLFLIASGYIAKATGVLKEEYGKAISGVVLNLTFPALIFTTLLSIEIRPSLFFLPLFTIVYGSLCLVIGFIVFRKRPRPERGALMMASNGFNIGFFAFPIIQGIWGTEGLTYIAMFDVGNAVILLGVNAVVASFHSPFRDEAAVRLGFRFILKSIFKSVPLLSYCAAVLLNLLGFRIPELFAGTFEALARANMALVLILLGMYIDFSYEKGHLPLIAASICIRYLIGLAVGIVLYFVLPLEPLFRGVLMIAVILPVGLSIVPYSVDAGLETRLAATLVSLTLILSFVCMWVLISGFGLS